MKGNVGNIQTEELDDIETPEALAPNQMAQLDFALLEKVFPNLNSIKFKPRSPQNEEEGKKFKFNDF